MPLYLESFPGVTTGWGVDIISQGLNSSTHPQTNNNQQITQLKSEPAHKYPDFRNLSYIKHTCAGVALVAFVTTVDC